MPSKNVEFEILLTKPHTLDSIPDGPGKPDSHDRLGWPYNLDGLDRSDDTNGSSRPNNLDGPGWPNDTNGLAGLMTQKGLTT